jgi:hypothetical protein
MSRAKPEPLNRATPWDRLLEGAVVLVGVSGVLGAVNVWWASLLWPLVRGPVRRREPWAWFAIAFAVPLLAIRRDGLSS